MPHPFRKSEVKNVTLDEGIVTVVLEWPPGSPKDPPMRGVEDYTVEAARELWSKIGLALASDGFKEDMLIELGQQFQALVEDARLRRATELLGQAHRTITESGLTGGALDLAALIEQFLVPPEGG